VTSDTPDFWCMQWLIPFWGIAELTAGPRRFLPKISNQIKSRIENRAEKAKSTAVVNSSWINTYTKSPRQTISLTGFISTLLIDLEAAATFQPPARRRLNLQQRWWMKIIRASGTLAVPDRQAKDQSSTHGLSRQSCRSFQFTMPKSHVSAGGKYYAILEFS
jgi:hypothetical protein